MLQILVLAALCLESHADSNVTLSVCVDKYGNFAKDATDCDDQYPQELCERIFLNASAGEVVPEVGKGDNDRPANCWSKDNGETADSDFIKFAANTCPKTCGLCCKTAKYNCKDDEKFDCDKVRKSNRCKDPWKLQLNLVDKCPKTCGLCEEKNGSDF